MATMTTSRIEARWPYLLFLLTTAALMVYVYVLSNEFRLERTGALPRLVVIVTLAVIVLDLLVTTFPQVLPANLIPDSPVESGFGERNIGPFDIARQFGWVLAYLAGLNYVGFFTTSFAFAFLYIYSHDTDVARTRRLMASAVWSLFIVGFLWVLFVELLRVSSVFEFGLLP